jgi:hypothetical protein
MLFHVVDHYIMMQTQKQVNVYRTTGSRVIDIRDSNACPLYSKSLSGSGSVSECLCQAGYGGSSGGPCESSMGTYKPSNGNENCISCPSGSSTLIKMGYTSSTLNCTSCEPCEVDRSTITQFVILIVIGHIQHHM